VDEHATALYESVIAAVPGWIERSVARVVAVTGTGPDPDLDAAAVAAGARVQAEVGVALKTLLAADIDAQGTTPLSILRAAVGPATEVLRAAAVPPLPRDESRQRLFPDDIYDLSPAALGDVDPALAEVGLIWGAHKAMAHLQRHGRP
jgi:hypothetical protein